MISRALFALTLAFSAPVAAEQTFAEQRAEWNRPTEPFRIIGNVHYVGTAQIGAYLVAGPDGHVLIDGAMEESATQIAANVRSLGFRLEDVRYILINHAHWDHSGGLAELKRLTGARLVASAADTADLEQGFNAHRDDTAHFPPVAVDRQIGEGDRLALGGLELTAHLTPGHTPGCTSWTLRTEEGGRSYDVLFACSLTVAAQKLVNDARYPNAGADFEASFARLRTLSADVFLGFHGGQFGLEGKRRRLAAGDPLAFVDPAELSAQIEGAEAAYRNELERQRTAARPSPD